MAFLGKWLGVEFDGFLASRQARIDQAIQVGARPERVRRWEAKIPGVLS